MNHGNRKLIFMILIITIIAFACKKLPFVPGDDAIIQLTVQPDLILPGDSALVVAVGLKENGYSLPDGTIVYLISNTGTLAGEVVLQKGRGETLFQSDPDYTGDVVITARCGQAVISPSELILVVSAREVAYLYINAQPSSLPYGGGSTLITAQALDKEMNPIPDKTLWLSSDWGSLQNGGSQLTNSQGIVTSQFITNQTATVTVTHKEIETHVQVTLGQANQPPYPGFVYSPTQPLTGETVYFNAESSTDTDGRVTAYYWDMGDGKKKQGRSISHIYSVERTTTFTVTLRVVDDLGAESSLSKEITVIKQ